MMKSEDDDSGRLPTLISSFYAFQQALRLQANEQKEKERDKAKREQAEEKGREEQEEKRKREPEERRRREIVEDLLTGLQITEQTINILVKHEILTIGAFMISTADDLKHLGITAGQALEIKSRFCKESAIHSVPRQAAEEGAAVRFLSFFTNSFYLLLLFSRVVKIKFSCSHLSDDFVSLTHHE